MDMGFVDDFTFIYIFLGSFIVALLYTLIIMWKVFKKAGKPGWATIIPIYNFIVMFQIAGISPIKILLFIIPIYNIYLFFKLNISISKKFNKDTGFGILLTLIPVIGYSILAFSKNYVYDGSNSETETEHSILDVQGNGVPNDSDNKEFSYGYQKEETIAMNPVNESQQDSVVQEPQVNTEVPSVEETQVPEVPTNEVKEDVLSNQVIMDSPIPSVEEAPIPEAPTQVVKEEVSSNQVVMDSPIPSIEDAPVPEVPTQEVKEDALSEPVVMDSSIPSVEESVVPEVPSQEVKEEVIMTEPAKEEEDFDFAENKDN